MPQSLTDFGIAAHLEAGDFGGREFGFVVPASSRRERRDLPLSDQNCELCT